MSESGNIKIRKNFFTEKKNVFVYSDKCLKKNNKRSLSLDSVVFMLWANSYLVGYNTEHNVVDQAVSGMSFPIL